MQFDEALGKVTDPELKAYFKQMYSEQNSYITKLEQQLKAAKEQPSNTATPSGAGVNDVTAKYIEKTMRRDVIAEAEATVKPKIGEEKFNALKEDWMKFLDEKMTKELTTVGFAVNAFQLVLGECVMNADHPVNKIGKTTPQSPSGTPAQPVTPATAGTNAQAVNDVQNILRTPPVITNGDGSAQPGVPNPGETPIRNTKDSFNILKQKLGQMGGGKFQ